MNTHSVKSLFPPGEIRCLVKLFCMKSVMHSRAHSAYKDNSLPAPAKMGLNPTSRVTTQDNQVWEFLPIPNLQFPVS